MNDCYSSAKKYATTVRILISLFLVVLFTGLLACDKSPTMVEENSELDIAAELNKKAVRLFQMELYSEAEPVYLEALKIKEEAMGPDHQSVAVTLNNLGELYRTIGKYEEAEPLFKRALKIDEKVLGPEHADVATDLNNLAVLYYMMKRYEEAAPLYKRAIAILTKELGAHHPTTAKFKDNYEMILKKQLVKETSPEEEAPAAE